MDAERKTTSSEDNRFEEDNLHRIDNANDAQPDATNSDAMREAARLGGDNYIVKSDLEDADEREDDNINEDGSVSSMANADNPER